MIQVCSRCGTRWNVRDRQRGWCPRCSGALLAPTGSTSAPPRDAKWAPHHTALTSGAVPQGAPQRLPVGYRWIAVRPGSGPPPRRRRPPLGPTPRYTSIPRWGLQQYWDFGDSTTFGLPAPAQRTEGPSPRFVRVAMLVTTVVFGVAALAYLGRYALLLVNRSVLLNPILAELVIWGTVVAGVLALFAMYFMQIALAYWLVARRAAAFASVEHPETRRRWQLYCGCLVPVANLFFAPVFVIELAKLEARHHELRRPIAIWWAVWVFSFLLSSFAAITALPFITDDMQGAADNTLLTAIAYVVAAVTVILFGRVFSGFESTPVERPVKRWVVAGDGAPAGGRQQPEDGESAVPVEHRRREPAA